MLQLARDSHLNNFLYESDTLVLHSALCSSEGKKSHTSCSYIHCISYSLFFI